MRRLITLFTMCFCIIYAEAENKVKQDTLIVPDKCTIYLNTSNLKPVDRIVNPISKPIWAYHFPIEGCMGVIFIMRWDPSCPMIAPTEKNYEDAVMLYNNEFSNGYSKAFTAKGSYHREDLYIINSDSNDRTKIRASYTRIPENLRAIADSILNTIRIVSKDSVETCGCRPGGALNKDKTCHNNRDCHCSQSCDCRKRSENR